MRYANNVRIPRVVIVMAVAGGAGAVAVVAERLTSGPAASAGVGARAASFRAPPEPCPDEPERVRANDPEFAERWAKRFKEWMEHPESDPCRSAPRTPSPADGRELTDEEQKRLDDMDRVLAPSLPDD